VSQLPGTPGPALTTIWSAFGPQEQQAVLPHLLGDTPADWLASLLRRHGHTVSASTIRTYRRALRQEASLRD